MSAGVPGADVALVLAAAGSGTRYSHERNKLLEPLCGIPLFLHSIHTFAGVIPFESMVLVVGEDGGEPFRQALAALPGGNRVRLVTGGPSRAQSVLRGLEVLPPTARFVAVQDAARPLTSADLLCRCIASARSHGSGVAARRVTDTIKVADGQGRVLATPDRDTLWAAETPQVFRTDDLRLAYREALGRGRSPTDDAAAVEALALPVYLVESRAPNPKVTHAADALLVAFLLSQPSPPSR